MKKLVGVFMVTLFLSSCAPEIGSEKWCADMKEKSKADWTATLTKNFTKHCILIFNNLLFSTYSMCFTILFYNYDSVNSAVI
mgnify:CR=1 FL=1